MNIVMRFPRGRLKALTLSYDDGAIQDKKLIEILKPYGIKATFNINSGLFSEVDVVDGGRMSEKQVLELYRESGHEVAVHSVTHPFLDNLPISMASYEILKDRKKLEGMFNRVVRGMAYPYGAYNEALIEVLKNIGIAYSRTVVSTHDFRLPENWMKLTATCHHKDSALMELTDKFINTKTGNPLLFYLWGHSYEFDSDNNWNVIEEFAQKIGNREDIWYATNIEIYDYIEAFNNLKFSVDGKYVYNPSGLTIWIEKDGEIYNLPSNETTKI